MGTTGATPGSKGRFDGFDVLSQVPTWDDVTKGIVLRRLGPPPPIRFLSLEEEATARPLLDRLLGQDEDPKVPVLEWIDQRLLEAEGDGYRYDSMPEDGEAWRRSLAELDRWAVKRHDGRHFRDLDRRDQERLVETVRLGEEIDGMPCERVWNLWMRYALTAFYSHPWAWNEIGYGGPAYPRGYKNLGLDGLEPWERHERGARDPVPWARRAQAAKDRYLFPWRGRPE